MPYKFRKRKRRIDLTHLNSESEPESPVPRRHKTHVEDTETSANDEEFNPLEAYFKYALEGEKEDDNDNPWFYNTKLSDCLNKYYRNIGSDEITNTYELDKIKKSHPEIYEIALEARKELMRDLPNPYTIYNTPMRKEDRIKLLEKIDTLLDAVPLTEHFFELKENIKSDLKEAVKSYELDIKYDHQIQPQLEKIRTKITIETFELDILNLETDDDIKAIILDRYDTLNKMMSFNDEKSKLFTWLKFALRLPFNRIREIKYDNKEQWLLSAKDTLDKELYKMENVKNRLLLFLNNYASNNKITNAYLGLIGSAGSGKTLIAKCVSKIAGLPFSQISCGLLNNVESIIGHSYTYVGSQYGQIARCLIDWGVKNGIMFFDEFDKILNNNNLIGTMLHIIDPEQNNKFQDMYFDRLPIDLNSIWFIFAMNRLTLSPELNDRIYKIEIEEYSIDDKIVIIKDYILPKELANLNLPPIKLTEETIRKIIMEHQKTAQEYSTGLREIKNTIKELLSKIKFIYENPSIKLGFWIEITETPIIITPERFDLLFKDKKKKQQLTYFI